MVQPVNKTPPTLKNIWSEVVNLDVSPTSVLNNGALQSPPFGTFTRMNGRDRLVLGVDIVPETPRAISLFSMARIVSFTKSETEKYP